MDAVTVYICHKCDKAHDTKEEAFECCNLAPTEKYRCDICGEIHDTPQRAEDCCVTWSCPNCGEEFSTEDEADDCGCLGDEE